MASCTSFPGLFSGERVGSYLLLNTRFHWPKSVVLPIVFCAKSIVIFIHSSVLLVNPEAR